MSIAPNAADSTPYSFAEIEPKWERRWEDECLFHSEPLETKPNWVIIELPPFANGSLHMGHVRNYTLGDVCARFRRMAGFNVLYTSGFDSFGLPNELAAQDAGRHPKDLAEEVMAEMRQQFVRLGLSHDTRRIIGNHDEGFYGWVQWVFLKLFEQGLAYRQRGPVNWCASCNITLADSLAVGGRCWRCGNVVETRLLEQWLVRETDFADDMLESLARLQRWPQKIKRIHIDWIGRRAGVEVRFALRELPSLKLTSFVAHTALLPGSALIALAPEHASIAAFNDAGLLSSAVRQSLGQLTRTARTVGNHEFASTQTGSDAVVRLELNAIHPLTQQAVPIVVCAGLDLRSNDGIAVLFPSHMRADARLAALAGIETTPILRPPAGTADPFNWDESWIYTEASPFPERTAREMEKWVIDELERCGAGSAAVRYRLRDWNIARQRYWGPPVPIVHCRDCGAVAVPESDLPVLLPLDIDLQHTGNPLDHCLVFVQVTCPRCGCPARRDTDTLETYCSPWWYHWNCKRTTTTDPFDKEEARLYMPVDIMIGGEDQARTCFFHLRMMARALKRAGVVEDNEPIDNLLAIGMVKSNGRKMSKSEGNTVDPREIIARYGTDALRFAILAAAAPENDFNWSDGAVRQAYNFLNRVWRFIIGLENRLQFDASSAASAIDMNYSLSRKLAHHVETAVNRITEAMCQNQFHLAAANLEQLFERIEGYRQEALKRRKILDDRDWSAIGAATNIFLRMLTPLCPHITEELHARSSGTGLMAQGAWPGDCPPAPKNAVRSPDRPH
jgi:leucyl-tRNA synthetase